jgi:hypothetical protein
MEEATMNLISIERNGDGSFSGFVEDDTQYQGFYYHGDTLDMGHAYPKCEYRDYEHYVGVMSKFDPYTFFREKPIPIEAIDRETLERAWQQIKS